MRFGVSLLPSNYEVGARGFPARLFVASSCTAAAGLTAAGTLVWWQTSGTEQLGSMWQPAVLSFLASVLVAWLAARSLSRTMTERVEAIAAVGARYLDGDVIVPSHESGDDEFTAVARVLDRSVKELERQLCELSRDRARMQTILAGMAEGVLVVDREQKVQLVNQAARRMLRVDAGVTGHSYLEVIRHPDIAAQLTTACRGVEVKPCELLMPRDPGRRLTARAAPVGDAGGGGAVLVLHDITDLRRADQMRRDFVANVSHELRTPLTAIRGYVDALLDGALDDRTTRQFLEVIARQTGRMERLVKDLLRLARLDAQQESLDTAPCDLRALFQTVVSDLAPSIAVKRHIVHIRVPPEPTSVQADAAKLHDIVRNLLENAVNYSPEGGTIVLSAQRGGAESHIQVEDSGPGIPADDLKRVFERFYRVDKARTGPGTGLGLAIVKHLVELHGGHVCASNKHEGGAVFTVTLPSPVH